MRFGFAIGITFCFLMIVSSCAEPQANTTNVSPSPIHILTTQGSVDILDGSKWKLISILEKEELTSIPINEQPTIQFKNGEMYFEGKCNNYSGKYELDDRNFTISFAQYVGIDCPDLKYSVELEERFFSLMSEFREYALVEQQLKIRYPDGEVLLESITRR